MFSIIPWAGGSQADNTGWKEAISLAKENNGKIPVQKIAEILIGISKR